MIFVASPYGGKEENLEKARKYCRFVWDRGYTPYAPHLFFPQFLYEDVPEERFLGIEAGLGVMLMCNAVWVFADDGISNGMDKEIDFALKNGIPITYFNNFKPFEIIRLYRKDQNV
jgi:hypothetical protein